MGRPKIGEPLMVRLPTDLLAWYTEEAERQGIPRTELIRRNLRIACPIQVGEIPDGQEPI